MTPQEEFDSKYVTANELQQEMGVSRSSVMHARQAGKLPEPIVLRGIGAFVWERNVITPYMDDWRILLASRRQGSAKKRGPRPIGHNNLMRRQGYSE